MTGPDPLPPLARAFLLAGLAFFVVVALRFGAALLVPLVEAFLVCFVLNAAANAVRRLPLVGRLVPFPVALLLCAAIAFAVGFWVVQNSVRAVVAMGPQFAGYREAVGPLVERIAGGFGVPGPDALDRMINSLGLGAALRQVAAATAATVSHFSIVAIYVAFMFVDRQYLGRKLAALVPDPQRRERTRAVLAQVATSIETYLWIMTFVSALTALSSYAVMRAVGLDYAVFLATAIFFLNYIPTIGSILGTVVPAGFALLQFQAVGPTVAVLAGVGLVQFFIGNVVLPRIAGKSLNISLVATIFSLFFWGALWGVTGMFVAMPLTAILIIAFSHVEATRPFAILLSKTGDLDPIGASPPTDPGR